MLTEDHVGALRRDGYAVVPGVVPATLVRAARDAVCAFVGVYLERRETWYRHEPLDWSVVPVHHAQAFWDVRQLPALHQVFARLLGTDALWVSMDRGVFKVPLAPAHPAYVDESVLHWDIDPRAAREKGGAGKAYHGDGLPD